MTTWADCFGGLLRAVWPRRAALVGIVLVHAVAACAAPQARGQSLTNVWSRALGGTNSGFGWGLSVEGDGEVVVSGEDYPNALVAKFDGSGDQIWSKAIPANPTGGLPYDVVHDPVGCIFFVGEFTGTLDLGGGELVGGGSGFDDDIVLAKFGSMGDHQWSRRAGSPGLDIAWSAASDRDGNLLVTGVCGDSANFGAGPIITGARRANVFAVKYDGAGNHLWSRLFGSSSGLAFGTAGYRIAADAMGNVLIAGRFQGTVDFGGGPLTSAGEGDAFIAKFDASGNHLWSRRFGGIGQDGAFGLSLEAASGNVFLAGSSDGEIDFGGGALTGASAGFLAKLDSGGSHIWSASLGDSTAAVGLANVGTNLIAVTGLFTKSVDLGGGTLINRGGQDIFLAVYDLGGNHISSLGVGSSGTEVGLSAAADQSGGIFITGRFEGMLDFGGETIEAAGYDDIFLAKFVLTSRDASLDIKPGSCPNVFNTKPYTSDRRSGRAPRGVLPVALVGSGAFDVHGVDVASLRLEGVAPLRHGYQDVSTMPLDGDDCYCTDAAGDGIADLTLNFSRSDLVSAIGAVTGPTMLTLTGQMLDGSSFAVSDCVTAVGAEAEDGDTERESAQDRADSWPNGAAGAASPKVFSVGAPRPNPFNPTTSFEISVPSARRVVAAVYDARGRLVRRIHDGHLAAGVHRLIWNGRSESGGAVGGGVYFLSVRAGETRLDRRLVVLK